MPSPKLNSSASSNPKTKERDFAATTSKKKSLPKVLKHEVRIIGGHLKRTKLPVADKPGLRPSPDRVRETLFNWLGQDLTGWRCLDAFAGSGALGFEAASRDAALVQMIEMDPILAGSLEKTRQRLDLGAEQVQVRRGDGIRALADCAKASLDLVFLDPPFDTDLGDKALPLAVKAIKNNAWIYLESPTPVSTETLDNLGLNVYRQLKAGKVFAQLLQLKSAVAP